MAEDPLRRCLGDLLLDSPFFGSVASSIAFIPDPAQKSLAWSFRPGLAIRYRPDWLAAQAPARARGALSHELLHLVLLHPWRRGRRDAALWAVACDIAVNEQLDPRCLPDHAVTRGLIARQIGEALPPRAAAEDYYDILAVPGRLPALGSADRSVLVTQQDGSQLEARLDEADDGSGDEAPGGALVSELVRRAASEAPVPKGLGQALDAIHRPAGVNWRSVLKRFLATRGRTDSRASWKRESRRHEGFPGQRRAEGIDVLLALDESGSISHEWYGSFFSEVESLARLSGARIRVVRFDTECSEPVSVRRFLAERTRLKGGSTDFAAVFAMADRHRAPLLVVFTDGDGPCPAHVNQRVLWLLTPDGRQPAPFGHAVRLSLPGMA